MSQMEGSRKRKRRKKPPNRVQYRHINPGEELVISHPGNGVGRRTVRIGRDLQFSVLTKTQREK